MVVSNGNNGDSLKQNRARNFKIFGSIILVLALGGLIRWLSVRNLESTDDAYLESDIIQLAPQIGGRVVAVHFGDNDQIKSGDLLVEIDSHDTQSILDQTLAAYDASIARVAQAQAKLNLIEITATAERSRAEQAFRGAKKQVEQARFNAEAVKAELERAKADQDRYRRLYEATFASHQKLEQVEALSQGNKAKWLAAQAASATAESVVGQAADQLKGASTIDQQLALAQAELALATALSQQAQAEVASARLNLSYTKVFAPQDGRASKKSVAVGDMVQKAQVLTQIVTGKPWVVANFKETQLTHMRQNQKVTVKVDAFPDLTLTGHVKAIQPGTGARFSLLPPENATGNFIKVVQRVPVKIELDDLGEAAPLLVLGLSVTPLVDVSPIEDGKSP
jgi:membrane fusion protein, multidrug efflux system